MSSTIDDQKTKKRIFAVAAGISVGLLHFITGPQYSGPFPHFVNGYLIDILLPFVLFFLFTIHIRSIKWKIVISICILLFSWGVEE